MLGIRIHERDDATIDETKIAIRNLQVELEEQTEYEMHKEQRTSIAIQQELCKIGDIVDRFVKTGGVWKEEHKIKRIVLNGAENWILSGIDEAKNQIKLYIEVGTVINDAKNITNEVICMCSHLKPLSYDSRYSINNSIAVYANNCVIALDYSKIKSVEDFKIFLQNNNITVYYVLEQSKYVECTREQIEVLDNLEKIYAYEITNIYCTDNISPYMRFTHYTNNRFNNSLANKEELKVVENNVAKIEIFNNEIKSTVEENVKRTDSNSSKLTELSQNVDDFDFKMQNAGGVNLIRNSTLESGIENVTGTVTVEKNLDISNNTISKSAIKVINGSVSTEQIYIKENEEYTFSCLIYKNELTNVTVTIESDKTETYEIDCEAEKFQLFSFLIKSSINNVKITISCDNNYCLVADRMLNKRKHKLGMATVYRRDDY